MKSFFLSFLLSLSLAGIQAQSMQISETPATADNSTRQFQIAENTVNIRGNSPAFVSPSKSSAINTITGIAATVGAENLRVYDITGDELLSYTYELKQGDSSIEVYAKPEGGLILRENIANFLFFDTYGEIEASISNSSQSREGESISEITADPAYKTIVLYNPKIVRNGMEGSRVRVVDSKNNVSTVYSSEDRAIRTVKVSDNGFFIGVVTYKSGSDDELIIMDRFGNEINNFSFNQNITGFRISEDGRFLTLRSNSRVAVYSVVNGQRIGSTSFRSTLHFAEYIPEDDTIIALSGDQAGSEVSNIELHAINISERKLQRESYSEKLGTTSLVPLTLTRTGTLSYTISGLSKTLGLTVRF